ILRAFFRHLETSALRAQDGHALLDARNAFRVETLQVAMDDLQSGQAVLQAGQEAILTSQQALLQAVGNGGPSPTTRMGDDTLKAYTGALRDKLAQGPDWYVELAASPPVASRVPNAEFSLQVASGPHSERMA